MHVFLPTLPGVLGRLAPCGLLLALGLGSCTNDLARTTLPPTAQPLVGVRDAFESASEVQLPAQEPINDCGLRNAFRLSKNVYSGAEPGSEEAFARLKQWGVKTVISVDGKAPEVETAARHGLRYVHLPLHYKGIEDDKHGTLRVFLRRIADGPEVVQGLKRVSRPGCRIYVPKDKIPTVQGGLGINILSTSRGLMTGRQAVREGVGGEILCNVW